MASSVQIVFGQCIDVASGTARLVQRFGGRGHDKSERRLLDTISASVYFDPWVCRSGPWGAFDRFANFWRCLDRKWIDVGSEHHCRL